MLLLREILAEFLPRELVCSFDFTLGLLFELFDFALSPCCEALSFLFCFLASLFVNCANVVVEPAQQTVSFSHSGQGLFALSLVRRLIPAGWLRAVLVSLD